MTRMMSLMTMLCCLLGCKAQAPKFGSLNVEEFAQAIADTSVVRVDVRTADEYAQGHIDQAINIDVLQADFKSKALDTLPKEKTFAVYCRSGKRSKKAAQILTQAGYKVIELDTGYIGWTQAGKKVTK